MTLILNLTQHAATPDQVAQGVRDLDADLREDLIAAVTVEELPSWHDLNRRAGKVEEVAQRQLARWGIGTPRPVSKEVHAMIGGAPFLQSWLKKSLYVGGIRAVFAFSRREGTEALRYDGSTYKVAVFRHLGFIDA